MRRKTLLETQEVICQKLSKGYGQGSGINYRPWLEVGDFRNDGEQTIHPGIKIKRDHHLFSLGEYRNILIAEFTPTVVDIREQYPLLPIEESIEMARECGIIHPQIRGVPKVLTIDCLLTIESGGSHRLLARSIKRSKDLLDPKEVAKLELERRVCVARKIPWKLVTEVEMTDRMELNLVFLRKWVNIERSPPTVNFASTFKDCLSKQDFSEPLGKVLDAVAGRLHIAKSLAVWTFQYLAWHREIAVDLSQAIKLTEPKLNISVNIRS